MLCALATKRPIACISIGISCSRTSHQKQANLHIVVRQGNHSEIGDRQIRRSKPTASQYCHLLETYRQLQHAHLKTYFVTLYPTIKRMAVSTSIAWNWQGKLHRSLYHYHHFLLGFDKITILERWVISCKGSSSQSHSFKLKLSKIFQQ